MPALLASIATKNCFLAEFGIQEHNSGNQSRLYQGLKTIFIVADCVTRPGNDFRHKFIDGAEMFAKLCIILQYEW